MILITDTLPQKIQGFSGKKGSQMESFSSWANESTRVDQLAVAWVMVEKHHWIYKKKPEGWTLHHPLIGDLYSQVWTGATINRYIFKTMIMWHWFFVRENLCIFFVGIADFWGPLKMSHTGDPRMAETPIFALFTGPGRILEETESLRWELLGTVCMLCLLWTLRKRYKFYMFYVHADY